MAPRNTKPEHAQEKQAPLATARPPVLAAVPEAALAQRGGQQVSAEQQGRSTPPPPPPPQLVHIAAVPNGYTPDGARLRLSLVLSWRLSGGETLKEFPNLLHWTRTLQGGHISVALPCGANEHTVTFALDGLNPDLWESVFGDTTPVHGFRFNDLGGKKLVSLPTSATLAAIKSLYQSVGTAFPLGLPTAAALRPALAGFNPQLSTAQKAAI